MKIIADSYFFAALRKGPNRKLESRFPLPLDETATPTHFLVKIMSYHWFPTKKKLQRCRSRHEIQNE